MLGKWFGKKDNESGAEKITWQPAASQALEAAMNQAPVPKLLKGRLKKELMKAAEEKAKTAGHTEVTPQDLIEGLMAKVPPEMRGQLESMMQNKGLPKQ